MAVVVGGYYEHYKKKRYKVIGVAKHSETLEEMVVYQATYGDEDIWVRPISMFCEKIIKGGNEIDRFHYIGKELENRTKVQIDLVLPDDLKSIIIENNIDIENEILKSVKEVEFKYSQVDSNSNEKEVALIILASGATAAMVILALSKLIRTINDRPRENVIIEKDSQGNILRETKMLLEPTKQAQKTELSLEVGTENIKFKINDICGE